MLVVKDLCAWYEIPSKKIGEKPAKKMIVENLSFNVKEGEILGMVGESGSGKSTVSRAILGSINGRAARSSAGRRTPRWSSRTVPLA